MSDTGCTNCLNTFRAGDAKVFQGVVICDTCNKVVRHLVRKTDKELSMLRTVKIESLRAALASGRLHLPDLSTKEVGNGKTTTK